MNIVLPDSAPIHKFTDVALELNANVGGPATSASHVRRWSDTSGNERDLSGEYEDHVDSSHEWELNGDLDDEKLTHDGQIVDQAYRWIPGKGLFFDQDIRVNVPPEVFASVASQITIEINVIGGQDIDGVPTVLYHGRSSDGDITLRCHGPWSNNYFYFDSGATVKNGSTADRDYLSTSASERRNQVNQWIFTKDSITGDVHVYYNGALVVTRTGQHRSMEDIVEFALGAYGTGGNEWTGIVKDFRVWDRFFTQHDVDLLRNGTPLPDYTVDFSTITSSHVPGQDGEGTETIIGTGEGIALVGNRHRSYTIPAYTLTPNTVLEFDFESTVEGEVHGIGFDVGDTIYGSRSYKLFGTQGSFNEDWDDYQLGDGVKHYKIPIGKDYTGSDLDRLHIYMDNDIASPTSDSKFTNIRIYESTPKTDIVPRGTFTADSEFSSDWSMDRIRRGVADSWAASASGIGRWIQVDWTTPQAIDKVILKDRPESQSQITAGTLHFSDGSTEPVPTLPNDGSPVEITFAEKTVTWVKLVVDGHTGTYATGLHEMQVMSTTEDSLQVEYKFEDTEGFVVTDTSGKDRHGAITPGVTEIDFNNHTISGFSGSQDDTGTAVVEDAGATLHLTGNIWKKINLNYKVTRNTVIEFDFEGIHEGEEHAIGFENNNTYTANLFFQIWGSSTDYRQDHNDYDISDGVKHYKIRYGEIQDRNNGGAYLGDMIYLCFIGDDDNTKDGEVKYSNIKIYEEPIQVAFTKQTVPYNDTALRFLGGAGYVDVNKPEKFAGNITWMASIMTTGRGMHLYERGGVSRGYAIVIDDDGKPALLFREGGVNTTMVLNKFVADGQPHHIAISISDLYAYGLVDNEWIGAESGSIRAARGHETWEDSQIGDFAGTHPVPHPPYGPFKGTIDQLKLFDEYMDQHALVALSRLNTKSSNALILSKYGSMSIQPDKRMGLIHGTIFAVVKVKDHGHDAVHMTSKTDSYHPNPSTRLRQYGWGNRMGFTVSGISDWGCLDPNFTCDYDELMVVAYTSNPGDNYIHVSKNDLGRSSILTDADYQLPVDVLGSGGFEVHAYRICTTPLTEGVEKYLMKQYMKEYGIS